MLKIINPKFKHIKTVIILHGLNQSEESIINIVNLIRSKKRGIKFIIPFANKMNIVWPDGSSENSISWYNYYSRYDNLFKHDLINQSEFKKNTEYITDIFEQESKLIDTSKIFLCGISQGGTLAINVSLNLKFKINSIICIDTIFLHLYHDFRVKNLNQTYHIYKSDNDYIYNPRFQEYCYSLLENLKNKIIIKEHDLEHCESDNAMSDFILSIL
jgi:predicted esterase